MYRRSYPTTLRTVEICASGSFPVFVVAEKAPIDAAGFVFQNETVYAYLDNIFVMT